MAKLILIKHASPQVVPAVPPQQWQLSDRGRQSCFALAERLRPHQPHVVISSNEPKAVETAQLVAAELNLPHETADDLFEHDRSNVPHMRSGEFISMVELFFRRPDELVLGEETATEARQRFDDAVKAVLRGRDAADNIAIVSHGTVIALYLAQHLRQPPFQLWRQLGLPSMVVMELPDHRLVEMADKIG